MMSNPRITGALNNGRYRGPSCLPLPARAREDMALQPRAALGPRHKIYYFMCRFTCSRCWHTAVELAHYYECLQERNIDVILVGQGRYLKQATCLAAGLRLPFRLIVDDKGVLNRRFASAAEDGNSHRQSIVLVDDQGSVRYRQRVSSPGGQLRLASLMAVIMTLKTAADGQDRLAGRPVSHCA